MGRLKTFGPRILNKVGLTRLGSAETSPDTLATLIIFQLFPLDFQLLHRSPLPLSEQVLPLPIREERNFPGWCIMDKCFFCQSQDQVKTCAKCGLVSICQDLRHQQIHGDCCYPFRVVHSGDDRGRFLVATRPIEPQEVVFTDHPFVVVPR